METKLAKITSSIEANQALDRMRAALNDGYTGGNVSKNDLTSWIILHFENQSFQGCLENIRADHFDKISYLESMLKEIKKARKAGQTAIDLDAALAPLTKPSEKAKK